MRLHQHLHLAIACPACHAVRDFYTPVMHGTPDTPDPAGWAAERNRQAGADWLRSHPCGARQ